MNKAVKISLSVLLIAGISVFGFMYLKGSTFLNNQKKLLVLFPNVEGLIEASPLLVGGFKVGEVSKIELKGDSGAYQLLVTFTLDKDLKIPKDSQGKIISADVLGTKAVEVVFGQDPVLIKDGDCLVGITEESFKDKIEKEIEPLKDKANNLMSSIDSAAGVFKEIKKAKVQQNIVASFESIKKSVAVLKLTTSKVDTMMGPDKTAVSAIMRKVNSITTNLDKNKNTISKLLANFNDLASEESKNKVSKAMSETKKALADANTIVAYINSGRGTAGQFLKSDSIQVNLDKASKDLDGLLKDAIMNPDRYFHVSVFEPKKK